MQLSNRQRFAFDHLERTCYSIAISSSQPNKVLFCVIACSAFLLSQGMTQIQMPGTDASSLMALADARSGASTLIPGTQATILCCTCGAPMVWNPASMCANCIRTRVDITEGIPKSVPMQCCRACGRFLNPPKHWVACQPESKELLSICLKRIKGLNKVKLVDASFIWTEPHSRRLKVYFRT